MMSDAALEIIAEEMHRRREAEANAAPAPIQPKVDSPEPKHQNRGLPVIEVSGGQLPFLVDQAEEILIELDHEVYQRGDFVVRVAPVMVPIADDRQTLGLRLVPIKIQHMIERMTRIIDFQKWDARSKKSLSITCPPNVAASYLERIGVWKLPVLSGIATAPTMRPEGSILDRPGYDSATGLLYVPNMPYYAVQSEPTLEQARAALDTLCDLLGEFPFVTESGDDATGKPSPSRSVALSAILTTLVRRSLQSAPMHAFTAPVMGSGKSKLVDLASVIATGHEAPVIAQGKTEEEMEKRLGAALLAGDVLISFDNCEAPIGGELLCQALTQAVLSIRILGKSVNVAIPVNAFFAATGNNLVIAGDMARRSVIGELDPKVERPETTFRSEDPVARARRDRPLYVCAALTVLRAYHVAGRPPQATPLGSFEGWSRLIRDALIWLDQPDPCATMDRARRQDPRLKELAAVLHHWGDVIGGAEVTAKRAIEYATEQERRDSGDFNPAALCHPDFREALFAVAGDRGLINSSRLGRWLGKVKGRVIDGKRIEMGRMLHGENRWLLVSIK
jgi:putative DNA primase/helicase